MKRWVFAAALGLAAAGGIVAPGVSQASSTAWYQVYQPNVSGSFYQTAAITKNNIWAVGPNYTRAGHLIYQPFVRHFNGSSWQAITLPQGSTADWVAASAAPANNVWVGGLKNSSISTTVIYRWNGARWASVPLPALTFLQGVAVLAWNNVWAFGTSGTVAADVFHWNGSRWQYYIANYVNFIPQGISASAANNVWVSGFAYSGSKQVVVAYRWNGTAWHGVSMPHPVFDNAGPTVTAVSPSNVWIGWYNTTTTAPALHWDGTQWHTVTPPYYANPLDIVPDGNGGYWFGAQAILTGSTWTMEQVPAFSGSFGGVTRIPGTTSALLSAGVDAGGTRPTIFRFDL
ncbi:MAG TPA: hypothetical protein VH589_21520 [Trebonia sp.]|jgi:hypothetical protein